MGTVPCPPLAALESRVPYRKSWVWRAWAGTDLVAALARRRLRLHLAVALDRRHRREFVLCIQITNDTRGCEELLLLHHARLLVRKPSVGAGGQRDNCGSYFLVQVRGM